MTTYEFHGVIQQIMCDPKRDHLLELDLEKALYRSMLQLAVDIQELHPSHMPVLKHLSEKAAEDFFKRFK